MDKNATKYKSVDEYDDPANESVEKEASESTPTEQTDIEQAEMNMDASVTNSNGPDNMSFQTEVSGSSASEQKCVETTYLHQQGSFQLPPYEAVSVFYLNYVIMRIIIFAISKTSLKVRNGLFRLNENFVVFEH